jgi:hypothetical protein
MRIMYWLPLDKFTMTEDRIPTSLGLYPVGPESITVAVHYQKLNIFAHL